MIAIKSVSKKLGDFVLRDISLDINKNEYLVLLGASGVGKTVLLELLAGLTLPDRGTIMLEGRDITREKIQRRKIGLVYQDQALFPHMTVYNNIAYGLKSSGLNRMKIREKVSLLAEQVGVTHLLERKPLTLSGGEAQRTALARTLAVEPRCILLDEPLSSLDRGARSGMRSLLRNLHREGYTVIHVTHNYEEAVSLASRVAIMENGTITQTGSVEEVFQHPTSKFVAEFMGIRNFFKGELSTTEGKTTASFMTGKLTLSILTDADSGPGYAMIRSEDVTVSQGRPGTSARNEFRGTVMDIEPARMGMEIIIDIGINISALLTLESVEKLDIGIGKTVWISFKASAVTFFST